MEPRRLLGRRRRAGAAGDLRGRPVVQLVAPGLSPTDRTSSSRRSRQPGAEVVRLGGEPERLLLGLLGARLGRQRPSPRAPRSGRRDRTVPRPAAPSSAASAEAASPRPRRPPPPPHPARWSADSSSVIRLAASDVGGGCGRRTVLDPCLEEGERLGGLLQLLASDLQLLLELGSGIGSAAGVGTAPVPSRPARHAHLAATGAAASRGRTAPRTPRSGSATGATARPTARQRSGSGTAPSGRPRRPPQMNRAAIVLVALSMIFIGLPSFGGASCSPTRRLGGKL